MALCSHPQTNSEFVLEELAETRSDFPVNSKDWDLPLQST
jgi:hypothetical protein